MMQIRSILSWAQQELKNISSSAQLDAEVLLAYTLGLTRTQLFARGTQLLTLVQQHRFQQLILQRKIGMPIAYLIGEQEFWSLPLKVTPDTLIPRPETELLVEVALQMFPATEPIRILDLGTGSGAIALAIASERPTWQLIASDRSAAALTIAQLNAERLHLSNIVFRLGDWYNALNIEERFHLIVSNPPYLRADDPHLNAEIKFEPSSALISGQDGLRDLNTIIAQAQQHLLTTGWLLVEHGYDQANTVKQLFLQHKFDHVKQQTDLANIVRVTFGKTIASEKNFYL